MKPGDRVLIDDGRIALDVEDIRSEDVTCRVVTGGLVKDHKGVNLPGVSLPIPSLTRKDLDRSRAHTEQLMLELVEALLRQFAPVAARGFARVQNKEEP